MLPRWRDEVRLLLTPRRAALRRYARGLRPALVSDLHRDVAEAPTLHWTPALAALEALIESAPARGADTTVVVSSHFVRYAIVPASDLLVTQEDEAGFARHNFMRIHGAAAGDWSVRVSAGDAGGLASGIEQELVDALAAMLLRHGLRARALLPALMAAFNDARPELPAGACRVLVHEPGIAVSALLAPGWRRVRSQRVPGASSEDLARLIERDQLLEDEAAHDSPLCVLPLLPLAQPLPAVQGVDLRVLEPYWREPAHAEPAHPAQPAVAGAAESSGDAA